MHPTKAVHLLDSEGILDSFLGWFCRKQVGLPQLAGMAGAFGDRSVP
ncbi:MAG TPA: hypothetical protein VFS12_09110 [Terriglobia bacterium]|nr:hypothetical protein [Terriglobia bacterium]